jgi:CRP-like cAMP-binding protein
LADGHSAERLTSDTMDGIIIVRRAARSVAQTSSFRRTFLRFIHPIIRKSGFSQLFRGELVVTPVLPAKKRSKFNSKKFLSTLNGGRTIAAFPKKQTIFAQADSSDAVFYIQNGKVRLTVVSKSGKEATIGILNAGDFFGEGCLTGQPLRMSSATAMTDCSVMRIAKKSMIEVLHREHEFSDMFVGYMCSTCGWRPGARKSRAAKLLSCATLTILSWAFETELTPSVSRVSFRSGWQSSVWNYIRRRHV